MTRACVLLAVMLSACLSHPLIDSQRLFSIAVNRIQHLHMLAQRIFSELESSLQIEEQRQLNKIFLPDFCNSDDIISPIDKHETQRSSVLRLLTVSYRLIECWEFPSQSLPGGSVLRNQISPKLSELKNGIHILIRTSQGAGDALVEADPMSPYGGYYQALGGDGSLRGSYEMLACFKKDMHKVETYLTVAKCRLSPEDNCTL
ncbi:unnamed protein product [Gadus morhua 'NCC']